VLLHPCTPYGSLHAIESCSLHAVVLQLARSQAVQPARSQVAQQPCAAKPCSLHASKPCSLHAVKSCSLHAVLESCSQVRSVVRTRAVWPYSSACCLSVCYTQSFVRLSPHLCVFRIRASESKGQSIRITIGLCRPTAAVLWRAPILWRKRSDVSFYARCCICQNCCSDGLTKYGSAAVARSV
jgi:hypothetical protein